MKERNEALVQKGNRGPVRKGPGALSMIWACGSTPASQR